MTQRVRVAGHSHQGRMGRFLELDCQPDFAPGQHVGLSLPGGPPPRLYSVASVPGSPVLRILYTLVPEGELTPRLWELEPGDTVDVTPPAGAFFPQPARSLWIAAGTGIAPFMSMVSLLRDGFFAGQASRARGSQLTEQEKTGENGDAGPRQTAGASQAAGVNQTAGASQAAGVNQVAGANQSPAVTLLQSSRDEEDLWGQETFADLQAAGLLHYQRFVTRPGLTKIPPGIRPGRVLPWLRQLPLGELLQYNHIMICGSTQMILDTRDCLLELGAAFDRIVSEVYF